jgi:MtN3 and saliva related transmembrane protein
LVWYNSTTMLDPDLFAAAATCFGLASALCALLQARQVRRRGSSCEVSARFFATYAGGYAIWLLYGLSIGSVPLIVVDAVGLVCAGATLVVTLRLRGPGGCPAAS